MSDRTCSRPLAVAAFAALLALAGCSGANGYTQSPEELTPRLDIVSGDNQTAPVNSPFPVHLKVFFNKNGMPLGGHPVTFNAPEQGAGGTFPNGALSVTVMADSGGYAEAPEFTANGTAGSYTILAWNTNYRTNFHLANQ
jgi:hypothetical protein